MTETVLYILATVVLVLVVGFVANYLLALSWNHTEPQETDPAPRGKEPKT